MRNQLSFSDEDRSESSPRSAFCWWRTAEEYSQNGRLDVEDLSDLSALTPRLKLLREMERLALVSPEGLHDLRHKLITYRSGDFWVPTGGIKKEDMDIPPTITILLVGPSGSGKSSLVNMMYSVLGRSGLIPFAQTSNESPNYTTLFLEEHNVLRSMRSGFCVYDTRGLDRCRKREGLEEVTTWMVDGVRHSQLCSWAGEDKDQPPASAPAGKFQIGMSMSSARFAKRRVNCVMVVVNLAETYKAFKNGDLQPMDDAKDLFHCPSMRQSNKNPILILTHGDKLSCEERINGRLKICEYLGVPETTGAYDIACVTEYGVLPEESDPVTSFALTEVVYRALLHSDRTHLPKRKIKDQALLGLSRILYSIGAFFAFLAHFFSKMGHNKHKLKL